MYCTIKSINQLNQSGIILEIVLLLLWLLLTYCEYNTIIKYIINNSFMPFVLLANIISFIV